MFEPAHKGYGRIRKGTEQDGEYGLRNVMARVQGEIEYRVLLKLHFPTMEKRLKQIEYQLIINGMGNTNTDLFLIIWKHWGIKWNYQVRDWKQKDLSHAAYLYCESHSDDNMYIQKKKMQGQFWKKKKRTA